MLELKSKNLWVSLSIFNLLLLAILGFILRSKMLFEMPYLDYNHVADAHGHFAFGGWATLALCTLFVYELLPQEKARKRIYQYLLGCLCIFSWILIFTFALSGNSMFSNMFSTLFIFTTYTFTFVFSRDILRSEANFTVKLLSISSLVSLTLSSIGPFMLAILFSIQSLNAILYRDALFTYLHLQYNGFFTLAVFALLFYKMLPKVNEKSQKLIGQFAILLSLSVIPSLFLSYLWHDPQLLFKIVATAGSMLVFATFIWFVLFAAQVRKTFNSLPLLIKYLGTLSMLAFGIKEFLQGFTIFQSIGDAVFGSRPTIIGFLHLVFLGFTSLFILTWYLNHGKLAIQSYFTRFALILFSIGILLNEAILMVQGLGSMFVLSYSLFPKMLWYVSIILVGGAFLILLSRWSLKHKQNIIS